jgi:tRNA wybutosine-synthesizing protein 2
MTKNENGNIKYLAVPKGLAQAARRALEDRKLFDASRKITVDSARDGVCRIPIVMPASVKLGVGGGGGEREEEGGGSDQCCSEEEALRGIALQLGLRDGPEKAPYTCSIDIQVEHQCAPKKMPAGYDFGNNRELVMRQAVKSWLDKHMSPPAPPSPTLLEGVSETTTTTAAAAEKLKDELLAACPRIYALCPPLLILSKSAFSEPIWKNEALAPALTSGSAMLELYRAIVLAFGVTQLAKDGPVPLTMPMLVAEGQDSLLPNRLRSPIGFQPLYGDFGEHVGHPSPPLPPPSPPTSSSSPSMSPPSSSALSSTELPPTLWVSVKQNGIFQCWAPLYTMFSRGNVAEKLRLLRQLESEKEVIVPDESAAVDLYAGIGYFAFSYAKAGFARVLCWELNPWSAEGMRRGAQMNKWATTTLSAHKNIRGGGGGDNDGGSCSPPAEETAKMLREAGNEKPRIVIFEEDNVRARSAVSTLRHSIPPVRHVNCGLLPTAQAVWRDAVDILDPGLGGWVHVHESIADADKEQRRDEIVRAFRAAAAPWPVQLRHFRAVKSYAPGVTHYVLGLHVGPQQPLTSIRPQKHVSGSSKETTPPEMERKRC